MRKLSIGALFLCLMAVACKEKQSYHLPQEKMEQVLLDVHLAEVYSTMAGFDSLTKIPARSNDSLVRYYRDVLKHHDITLSQFKESLDWYRQRPELLDSMLNHTMNKLTEEEKRLMKKS